MTQREAAERMGVTEGWVRKLLWSMKKQGDAVVVHRLRGRTSNRKLPTKTQKQALAILGKPDWHDFGPTFAAEQLAKLHRIQVGKETLRGRMIADQCVIWCGWSTMPPVGVGAVLWRAMRRR
jgi:transposase